MIGNLHLLLLSLLAMVIMGQYSPLWQATPYIEAVSYTVLNNNHMAVSPFTLAVTFTSIFTTPKLAISIASSYSAIPSIRFTPGNVLAFRVYDTSLTTTGFTHNLVIPNTNTSLAFLTCRYIVFNTGILTKEFQVYSVADQAGTQFVIQERPSMQLLMAQIALKILGLRFRQLQQLQMAPFACLFYLESQRLLVTTFR